MTLTAATRIFNFSSGPAVLPLPVLEEAQRDLVSLPGVGMSVLEISHRSKVFDEILDRTRHDIRELAGVPENYQILFLQGGASLQFSMVPMNLLGPEQMADYVVSGVWSQKAVVEARKVGRVNVAASTESENFVRVPRQDELSLTSGAAYVHVTSNNTIYGTQFHTPLAVGDAPLVCDASSDIFSRPIDVSKYGVIYAGAQKNLGPSGVTLVIVRDDLLARSPKGLHSMLSYALQAENGSRYNTPPTFGIYLMSLVLRWLKSLGGLATVARTNARKASALYAEIDRTGFYRGHAARDSRSLMNVTFRLASEDLEDRFAREAASHGLDGLKGHRSVGGLRASIYNAFPEEGVAALVDFMRDFERRRG